ncbi:MAG: T9SS type A sorting domain-containing protein [Bacteroidota bacterium]
METNGNAYFSSIIKVAAQNKKQELILLPNPVMNDLSFMVRGSNGTALIRVIDINGRIVLEVKQVLNGNTSFNLPVDNLKPGSYNLILSLSNANLQRQFIKL